MFLDLLFGCAENKEKIKLSESNLKSVNWLV